ncbi:MAG: efflux RND transporter permease subunit [Armatimonadota bacterium]
MSLTRLAITRPVTILMLVLALVVLGWQSMRQLPVDLYPDIEFPMLYISTVYPGTGPEEIETLVSKPIEDAVSTVSGLKKLTSSSSEGVSTVMMEFEIGTDLDAVTSDVRSKVDAMRNALPDDAQAPVVNKLDVGAMPVVQLSLSSKRRSSQEVRRIGDDVIKDRLSQISGVAAVRVAGGDVREVRVEVDKARLEAYGVGISQVVSALQMENLNLPSGTIKESKQNFAVRVMGEFEDPEQINSVRIANGVNPNLTVRDVAMVRDTLQEASIYSRMNRGPSVAVVVQKQSDANTVKVVDSVRKELSKLTGRDFKHNNTGELKKNLKGPALKKQQAALRAAILPEDMQITIAFDQSTFIKDALDDVNKSLIEGALLAVIIVFLFLHSLRGTFIVGLAIPTSLIATFLVMRAFGFSINMMSMLGLSLCVGILVDDSIVVIENIHRHLRAGEPPHEAAMNGRTEIGLAAMTITMVDVVVFVPVAFMGGIVGQFFRQFGIVVAAATLFSLFISFTLTPMLASRWLKAHDKEEEEEAAQQENPGLFRRFTNAWERGYNAIDNLYRRILEWALDHRAVVICLGLMTMLASFASAAGKPWLNDDFVTYLPKAIVLLPLAMVLVAVIWWLIVKTQGWRRAILTIIGLTLSSIIIYNANLFAWMSPESLKLMNAKTELAQSTFKIAAAKAITENMLIFFVMLILMLAIIAYFFSRPRVAAEKGKSAAVNKPLVITTCILIVFVTFLPTKFIFEFQPTVDERQFSIAIEHEVGTGLEVTDATATRIEQALLDPKLFPETKVVTTTVGEAGGGMFRGGASGSDAASISVELRDLEDMDLPAWKKPLITLGVIKSPLQSTDAVMNKVNTMFAGKPGLKVTAAVGGGGMGGAPVSIEVSGPDMAATQRAATRIEQIVSEHEGTFSTELSWREGRPELQALIDRDRAAQYGISVAQVASALRTSLEGDTSTKFREEGKEYDIRVVLPKDQRVQLGQVPNLIVGNTASGQPVFLYEVAHLEPAGGPTKIDRTNRQRSVTVSSQLREGFAIGNVRNDLAPKIDALNLTGVNVAWAGEAEAMDESFGTMGSTLVLSILLVFMLMAALFESILSPLIILLAVPQAMAGALLALTMTHNSMSIVSVVGIIMLVGLVTKNAILMVDYTNTLRKEEGKDRRSALLQAGPTRLRPILMTTLAMIFGMMPTAIALSKGSEFRQPMAVAVIGGLILSLFLTLLMVPVFYEIVDDLGSKFARAKDRVIEKAKV